MPRSFDSRNKQSSSAPPGHGNLAQSRYQHRDSPEEAYIRALPKFVWFYETIIPRNIRRLTLLYHETYTRTGTASVYIQTDEESLDKSHLQAYGVDLSRAFQHESPIWSTLTDSTPTISCPIDVVPCCGRYMHLTCLHLWWVAWTTSVRRI